MAKSLAHQPPLAGGIHPGAQFTPGRDSPEYKALRMTEATSLKDLTGEYKLFTHGLLFTYGSWRDDPIVVYLLEENPEHSPFVIDLETTWFNGPRAAGVWARRLLAINAEGWEHFYSFMSLVSVIDHKKARFQKLLAQQLPIPDHMALANKPFADVCPMVDIVAFGVDGNNHAAYLEPALSPPMDKPRVIVSKPDPDTVMLGQRILSGDSHPYLATDQVLRDQTKVATAFRSKKE